MAIRTPSFEPGVATNTNPEAQSVESALNVPPLDMTRAAGNIHFTSWLGDLFGLKKLEPDAGKQAPPEAKVDLVSQFGPPLFLAIFIGAMFWISRRR